MVTTPEAVAERDVDPEIREFLVALNHGYGQFSDFDALPLPERRAAAESVREQWPRGGPVMAATRDLEVSGCRVRLHYPRATDVVQPALLYVHGGGWTMFSIDMHDRIMREYAARAGIVVVGVDYSLSPEAKYPVALDEVLSVFRWLRRSNDELGIDPQHIAIGGDSAGANLSVACCLRLRAAGEAMPNAMLLNYGAFDPAEMPSYARYDGPAYMLTIDEMRRFWVNYTDGPGAYADPLVCPLRADLAALPPAFRAIAECDILADANHSVAERLAAAGVPVEARVYAGATHSFPTWEPTWNYAALRIVADLAFVPEETDASLRQLTAHLEPGGNWTVERMGKRYDQLAQHIVAFRATVRSCEATFKLGQDEADQTFGEIVAIHEDRHLAKAMRRQRPPK